MNNHVLLPPQHRALSFLNLKMGQLVGMDLRLVLLPNTPVMMGLNLLVTSHAFVEKTEIGLEKYQLAHVRR